MTIWTYILRDQIVSKNQRENLTGALDSFECNTMFLWQPSI